LKEPKEIKVTQVVLKRCYLVENVSLSQW